jgi:hypothetical protein
LRRGPSSEIICDHLGAFPPIADPSPFPICRRIRLLVSATRVIHVLNAVITAEGEFTMITAETETTTTDAAVAAQGAHIAPEKASSKKSTSPKKGAPKGQKGAKSSKPKAAATAKPKKTTPAKKAAKAPKAAKPKAEGAREGSKTAQVVAMLQRKNGATLSEIMETMAWQKHTVRGFMAGAMKKAGYTIESFKSDKGERTYRINP